MTDVKTAAEVAQQFRCTPRKVTDTASKHGIGADFGGRAGFRFNEADVLALWEVLRPQREETPRRRRRAS